MGDIFQGIKGDFRGFALENADISPNPEDDDSDVDAFFNDDFGTEVVNTKAIKKSRKIFKKTQESGIFGGF